MNDISFDFIEIDTKAYEKWMYNHECLLHAINFYNNESLMTCLFFWSKKRQIIIKKKKKSALNHI